MRPPLAGAAAALELISIHAPLAGCDLPSYGIVAAKYNFNPRTPCGVRPGAAAGFAKASTFQSTHPLRGATACRRCWNSTARFQSTHPLRGATACRRCWNSTARFQSTHPLRGATHRHGIQGADAHTFQSTHPLRGATRMIGYPAIDDIFQSTHPLRGATIEAYVYACAMHISIHAPLAGCDSPNTPLTNVQSEEISIHAPLAGCDSCAQGDNRRKHHFNPRTPCGVRRPPGNRRAERRNFNPRTPCGVRPLRDPRWLVHSGDFNPRTPCGVRPACRRCWSSTARFQSTHPLRGATGGRPAARGRCCYFNPRTPCGVRRGPVSPCGPVSPYFNPRTPCGVRQSLWTAAAESCRFQSTHPLRGATSKYLPSWMDLRISIHAPLAGCDFARLLPIGRGFHFNPRTPCGVRPAAT